MLCDLITFKTICPSVTPVSIGIDKISTHNVYTNMQCHKFDVQLFHSLQKQALSKMYFPNMWL